MWLLRLIGVASLAAASAACFQMTDVMKVNADGSGTIEHRMMINNAAIAQMRQLAMLGGRGSFDPISEKQARDLAATIGGGAAYMTSTPIATPTGQGRESLYSFTDVNQLGIQTQPAAPGDVTIRAQGISSEPDTIRFTLSRDPNGNAILHVLSPPLKLFDAIGPATAPNQVGLIRSMLAGAHIALVVEPNGTLVRTSSAYVDGPRVTLLEIDLDEIVKNEPLIAKLQAAKNEDEIQAALKGAPGVKFNFERDTIIEFTPAAK